MAKKTSQAQRHALAKRAEANPHLHPDTLISVVADLFGGNIEPLMPSNLVFDNVFRSFFGRNTGKDRYAQARRLADTCEFFGDLVYLKELFFNDGFEFQGQRVAVPAAGRKKAAGVSDLQKWLDDQVVTTAEGAEKPYDFSRIVADAWQEWLVCDNIVAFWQENTGDQLPIVTILDCEICEYKNAFGMETLKIQVPKVTLSKTELNRLRAKGMDKRYLEAIEKGQALTLDEGKGERFRILTRAKLGRGLASPRVGLVLTELATMEIFGLGNWAAASQMSSVIRQVQKGHDIKAGPLSGQATHFMTTKVGNAIKNSLKNKRGAFDMVTNFDVTVKFPFLDPKYFDAKKFEGTLDRLRNWGGPVTHILSSGQISPFVMDAFGTEGRRQRQLVGDFLAGIFKDPSFLGTTAPPAPLVPRWNPRSFTTQKMLIELGRFLYSDGLASPQTLRPWFDLDDQQEGDRLEAANKSRQRFTPPFEAKQGMVSGRGKGNENPGGRPNESPGE